MGMRQNIALIFEGTTGTIYVYSHWGGGPTRRDSELHARLKKALARKERWDDEGYLARIIISEVIRDALDEETGYGIQPYEVDPEFPTIKVDLAKQTVNGKSFEEYIK